MADNGVENNFLFDDEDDIYQGGGDTATDATDGDTTTEVTDNDTTTDATDGGETSTDDATENENVASDDRFTLTFKQLKKKKVKDDYEYNYANKFTVKFGTPYVNERVVTGVKKELDGNMELTVKSVSFTLKDTLTLQKIDLKKRIGEHNVLEMEFQYVVHNVLAASFLDELKKDPGKFDDMLKTKVSMPYSFDKISSSFMCCFCELKQGEKVNGSLKEFVSASSYKVTDVKPKYISRGESGCVVSFTYNLKVTATSWDVLTDMTKYSRAYTAKKLGEDIVKGMMGSISLKQIAAESSNEDKDEEKLTTFVDYNTSDMRVLRVKTKKGSGATSDDTIELRLPYLVQYNETDYNFLLRTANRFGEFLYFEDGKLHLGLKNNATPKNIASGSTSSIEFIQSDDQNYAAGLSYHKSTDGTGYSQSKPFVADFANDDYFDIITKSAYDEKGKWMDMQPALWSRMLSIFFQYEHLSSMFVDMAVSEGVLNGSMSDAAKKSNESYDKKYFDNYSATNTQYEKSGSDYRLAQFADLFGSSSTETYNIKTKDRPDSVKIWNVIEEERRRALTQYKIRFDKHRVDLKLGDLVKVADIAADKNFVVVDVNLEADSAGTDWTEVTVIPEIRSKAENKGSFEPYAMPIPLPADVEMTRESGAQAAVVTDASDPKRFGRVRVRYHWQSGDTDATPWIRVAVPFASDGDAGYSGQFTAGDEVMVDYENGNVERPYVVGALYNSENNVPYGQRKYSQILRSRNGHMIGVREPTNSMNILSSFLPGLKMFGYMPGFNFTSKLDEKNNRKTQMAMGGFDICDNYGIYSISTSSDQRNITLSSPFGTVNMDAAMGITISAPNGNVRIVGKNVDIVAGNNLTLKSGTNIDNALLSSFADTNNIKKVGITELNVLSSIAASFFDIPALRFAIELLFKPVAGTLKVHSGRYLMLEAGGNAANMPSTANKYVGLIDKKRSESDAEKRKALVNEIVEDCKLFKGYLNICKNALVNSFQSACEQKASTAQVINTVQGKKEGITAKSIIDHFFFDNGHPADIVRDDVKAFVFPDGFAEDVEGNTQNVNMVFASLIIFKTTFSESLSEFDNIDKLLPNCAPLGKRAENLPKGFKLIANTADFKEKAKAMSVYHSGNNVPDEIKKFSCNEGYDCVIGSGKNSPASIYKTWVKAYLDDNLKALHCKCGVDLNEEMSNWDDYIKGFEEEDESLGSSLGYGFLKEALDNLLPWDFWNIYAWGPSSDGKILMSQEKDKTIVIERDALHSEPLDMTVFKESLKDLKDLTNYD